jgi:2-oxoglutarate ferredoxin oxidoreductase subunit gamma
MHTDVMFAGFGGQGIMLIGQMLAYAGMNEGKEVVWLPSYGPEMRGGTAYCTVVVSDRPIGSPILDRFDSIAVLNRPSLEKFASRVEVGGLLLVNTSLIDITSGRTDIVELGVPANEIALECGAGKAANMAVLGAYVGYSGAVEPSSIEELVRNHFERKPKLVDINMKVLERGLAIGRDAAATRKRSA